MSDDEFARRYVEWDPTPQTVLQKFSDKYFGNAIVFTVMGLAAIGIVIVLVLFFIVVAVLALCVIGVVTGVFFWWVIPLAITHHAVWFWKFGFVEWVIILAICICPA